MIRLMRVNTTMRFEDQVKGGIGLSNLGRVEGESALAVRNRSRSSGMNFKSVSVAPVVAGLGSRILGKQTKGNPHRDGNSWSLSKRIHTGDLVVVLSQLSIMCQSGDDLAEAIKAVALQCKHPKLRPVLHSIYRNIEQGNTFSKALAQHPQVFDTSMIAAIDAGEQSGRLTDVLDRLTRLLRKDVYLRSVVGSMMTYPIVLCVITSAVVAAMFFFVLPQFAKVFTDMDRPIPPLTNFLLGIGVFLRSHIVSIGVLLVTMAAAIPILRRRPEWKRFIDYSLLNTLVVKTASRPLIAGRLFRLMGTMLENGVPLLDTIQLAKRSTRNVLFQNLFNTLERDILNGAGIGTTLQTAVFLPEGAAHMIATGERTARLPFVLQSIGEYFEDEGEQNLRWIVKILEPTIIIGLGAVVGTIVLSIVLPMLDMTTIS